MNNFTAVILAAGLGTRMKTDTPKVLHLVGNETMLGRTIHSLRKAGIDDIIVVVGYKADIIEQYFEDVRFARQPELLGSGDALAHAVDYMPEGPGSVLVTCGDTPLITEETYRALAGEHRKAKASCTLLTAHLDDPNSYGRIVRDKKDAVCKIVEEKDATKKEKQISEINVGTYCFQKADLKRFIRDIELNEKKKEFYLTDIVDILTKNGKKIRSRECDPEEMIGINSRKDLAVANSILNKNTLERAMAEGVTVVDLGTTRIDETAVIGKDTVICPNTVIEQDVEIGTGCQIGPFARLRPGTRVSQDVKIGNFVELSRAKIGQGSAVKHHTYLGDAEVGKNVNIGAGTITANYDGSEKHGTVIGDDAMIGAGVILIAPVKVGKKARIGAGSVVTKKKNVPDGTTVVGVPARTVAGNKKK
ncbi:MAG: NTP transferase domain-containing protein [Candidatus Tantalella remota]|nr:NTP transferase domain-containing protein [Candidatus Tantalella remota]